MPKISRAAVGAAMGALITSSAVLAGPAELVFDGELTA